MQASITLYCIGYYKFIECCYHFYAIDICMMFGLGVEF